MELEANIERWTPVKNYRHAALHFDEILQFTKNNRRGYWFYDGKRSVGLAQQINYLQDTLLTRFPGWYQRDSRTYWALNDPRI